MVLPLAVKKNNRQPVKLWGGYFFLLCFLWLNKNFHSNKFQQYHMMFVLNKMRGNWNPHLEI